MTKAMAGDGERLNDILRTQRGGENCWICWKHTTAPELRCANKAFVETLLPKLPRLPKSTQICPPDHHSVKSNLVSGVDLSDFYWQTISQLLSRRGYSLPWLFLLLCSEDSVRRLLRQHSLNPQSVALKPSSSLSLSEYLQQLINNQALQVTANCLDALSDVMELLKKQSIPPEQLYDWFAKLTSIVDGGLVRLHLAAFDASTVDPTGTDFLCQSAYVELQGKKVQVYGLSDQPILLPYEQFLAHLNSHFATNKDTGKTDFLAAEQVMLELYVRPADFTLRLERLLLRCERRWEDSLNTPFSQFIAQQ